MAEVTTDALIDKADLITITDKLGAIYDLLYAALTTATTGAQALAQDCLETIMALTNVGTYLIGQDLRAPANTLGTNLATANVMQLLLQSFIGSLNTHCQQRGSVVSATIVSMDSFATYWNAAGSFFDVLFSPSFRDLYYAAIEANPSIANCYSPEIATEGYTNAMGKFVVSGSVFTAGQAVDTSKYGMAYPKLKVSVEIVNTGSGIVITVTGKDHLGEAAKTWTKTVEGAGNLAVGDYDFAEVATRWIREVTGIAVTGASSGTLYVEGWKPAGRP